MKVHHIAIATKDIEESSRVYSSLGFDVGECIDDLHRDVKICFISLGGGKFELVQPLSKKSPVYAMLEKNEQDTLYHICYEVKDISEARKLFLTHGFLPISKIEPAVAIENKNVMFLYHRVLGLVELVEE